MLLSVSWQQKSLRGKFSNRPDGFRNTSVSTCQWKLYSQVYPLDTSVNLIQSEGTCKAIPFPNEIPLSSPQHPQIP